MGGQLNDTHGAQISWAQGHGALLGHNNETLLFRAKHPPAVGAEGLSGMGAEGGIHKVDVSQPGHIVALVTERLAARRRFGLGGDHPSREGTDDGVGKCLKNRGRLQVLAVKERVVVGQFAVEALAIEDPAVKAAFGILGTFARRGLETLDDSAVDAQLPFGEPRRTALAPGARGIHCDDVGLVFAAPLQEGLGVGQRLQVHESSGPQRDGVKAFALPAHINTHDRHSALAHGAAGASSPQMRARVA